MGNLLETLKKQAAIDADEQADLMSDDNAVVLSAESESFGLGQEIWWKPDPTTPEMGPGKILFRKIDYKLLQKETVNHGPQMEENLPRCSYAQVVSKVLVQFQGRECLMTPSTITKWGYHPFDGCFKTSRATSKFVSCECPMSIVGPRFDIDYSYCGEPFECYICCICGAIAKIPVATPYSNDPCL